MTAKPVSGDSARFEQIEAALTSDYQRHAETGVWSRAQADAFQYSDGDEVEARILTALRSVKDRSVLSDELLPHKRDWASTYHLSSSRANLLRPLERHLGGAVLELGAGCGALTRYLGETAQVVVAVEGSARRAQIAALRCEDLPNVRVVRDHFDALSVPPAAFDAVTLVGVLEYARVYGGGPEGVDRLLAIALRALRPGGVLVLAIENQLGLKYLAGVPEDHLGKPMYGINDLYSDHSVVTFGRTELLRRLRAAGFESVDEYVPLPDYKLPVTIIHPIAFETDVGVDLAELLVNSVDADAFSGAGVLFAMERAWPLITRNALVRDLANSFLMVASPAARRTETVNAQVVASHYGVAVRGVYLKETRFVVEGGKLRVRRCRLDAARAALLQRGIGFVQSFEDEDYFPGTSAYSRVIERVNRDGWTAQDVATGLADWFEWLKRMCVPGTDGERVVPSRLLDATPANLLINGNNLRYIDAEWSKAQPTVELGFVAFRGLYFALNRLTSVAPPSDGAAPVISQLTLEILAAAGIPVSRERAKQYWMEVGQLHETAFGTPFVGVEYFDQRKLTVRRSPAELLRVFDEAQDTEAKRKAGLRELEATAAELKRLLEAAEEARLAAEHSVLQLRGTLEALRRDFEEVNLARAEADAKSAELRIAVDTQRAESVERDRRFVEAVQQVVAEKAALDQRLGETREALRAQLERAAAVAARCEAAEQELLAVRNTWSWRITSPLRAIRRRFSRS